MIRAVLRAAFRRPALVLAAALAAVAAGAYAYTFLTRDVFPDLAAPVFNIIVQNAAMAPEELESAVTLPVETSLTGIPGARRVRSRTEPGVAQITIEFEPDWDYYRARQLVGERVGQLAGVLPAGTSSPILSSFTARLNEIMEVALWSPNPVDPLHLRDLAELEIKNRILGVPGVAMVERIGGALRQFQIEADAGRMRARGIALEEVVRAARSAGRNAAGGILVTGATEWPVRAIGRTDAVADLARTVVREQGGAPVLLGDVAHLQEGGALRRGLARRESGEYVNLRIVKQFGSDTTRVSCAVRKTLSELRASLPAGVRLDVVYDQGAVVERTLSAVGKAVLLGAGLVVLVLLLLLGSWRGALLTALTLPVSVAITGLLFWALGVGLNMMTLGGIAIAVGLLADASIIMVENLTHRGSTGPDGGFEAAAEVARPIFFAIVIVVAVFLPLAALQGVEGKLYRPMALAVVGSMMSSLALSLTVVPPIAARILRGRRDHGVAPIRLLKRLYRPVLEAVLRRGWVVLAASAVLTTGAVALSLHIGSEFVPDVDEGALIVTTLLPPEASLVHVDRMNQVVEERVRGIAGVAVAVRRTGRSEDSAEPMQHTESDILLVLAPGASARSVKETLRHKLRGIAGLSVLLSTPLRMRIDEGLGGTPADIVIRVFGSDLERLDDLATRAERIARTTPGLAEVRREPSGGAPQLHVKVDHERAARYAARPGDIADTVRVALAGEVVGGIWRGQRRHDLVVRLGEADRRSADAIRMLLVPTAGAGPVMLQEVARVGSGTGIASLRREQLSRRIGVEAMARSGELGRAAAELRRRLTAELSLPAGYFVELGGRVESKARAERTLLVAIAVSFLLVVFLLYTALGRGIDVAAILLTLPTAFVGAIVALWAAGESWNVSSLVGLIGLFGIAVQNALVVVTQTREREAHGMDFESALRDACIGRVRPKLLTAGAAILGLLPILVLPEGGMEVERPLAVVMTGGLVTSTLFTLLALPALYRMLRRRRLSERSRGRGDRVVVGAGARRNRATRRRMELDPVPRETPSRARR